MIDNFFIKEEIRDQLNETERIAVGFHEGVYTHLMADGAEERWVSPNSMSNELAAKCPKTLIITTEFDMYRRSAEKAAALFERNGKLLEFGILKGCHHGHYFDFN
jgi:acetyl esterase/lipase